MTSKDEFKNLQGFWKKLSGEDQCTLPDKDKNKDRISDGVTYSAPFTMYSNNKVQNKRDDKYMSDERVRKDKEWERISDAVDLIGRYVCTSDRCLELECEPVVDVVSVRLLCKNNARNEPRKICGVIFIFDHRGHICFIYEKDEFDGADRLDVIPVDGTLSPLSFRGPDDVMSMHSPDICVNIKDYATGEVIVKGFAPLSTTVDTAEEQNHRFEQFRTITIVVMVKLCGSWSKDEEEEDFLIYGKISVEYNLYHCEKRSNSITLFEIKEDSRYFEETTLDSPITLSRSEVAVPAYSYLTVRVELWSEARKEPIVHGSFAFDTNVHGGVEGIIPGVNRVNAEVTVYCKQPSNQRSIATSNPLGYSVWKTAVEVFSLFIGHQNDKDLSLYGMINFRGSNIVNIFERDKNDPYILPRGWNFLPLQIHSNCLVPGDFSQVSVDLEDVEGLVSIKGLVIIDVMDHGEDGGWYNRLFCSVVKGVGNRSFAALHYTVYCHAQRAKLKVQFYSESEHFTDTCIRIHGSLVLRYGEFGIKTQYEKMYHRCVLFRRHKENPLEKFGNNLDLELSRSLVVVPCNSSILIVANLSCCSSTGFTAYLSGAKEFHVGTENATIDGDEFSLNIAVKWI
ncbi:60 kDa jasmonate-induced protein [Bienertia sinuspersici]